MKHDWTTRDAAGRIGAVLIGSSLVYLAFNFFCLFSLPARPPLALGIAVLGGFPLWIAAMCYAMLARTSLRAWAVLLLLALLLAAHPLLIETFS